MVGVLMAELGAIVGTAWLFGNLRLAMDMMTGMFACQGNILGAGVFMRWRQGLCEMSHGYGYGMSRHANRWRPL
ncbi:hypothetical protein EGI20_02000 [Aquitalea sp. S1-19]|nr:hypothetical protein [Aquitalea sp. S1-19]